MKKKYNTLVSLLVDGAVKFHEVKDVKFYEIGNDKYMVVDGKVIGNYNLDDKGLREKWE